MGKTRGKARGKAKCRRETEVKAPVIDDVAMKILQPAGPGTTFWHVSSDDDDDDDNDNDNEDGAESYTAGKGGQRPKPSVEALRHGRSQSWVVKSEDADEDSSTFFTPPSRQEPRMAGSFRGHGHQVAPSPWMPSRPPRFQSPRIKVSPASISSTSGPVSSSSSEDSDFEVSSVFRPTLSPSRFVDTPPSVTRSQKNARPHEEHIVQNPSPTHSTRTTAPEFRSRQESQSMFLSTPHRASERQCGTNSQPGSHTAEPQTVSTAHRLRAQSIYSPATSLFHGWRPINKDPKKGAIRSSTSNEQSQLQPGRSGLYDLPDSTISSSVPGAATASGHVGVANPQTSTPVQTSAKDWSPSTRRSPKSRARAVEDEDVNVHDGNHAEEEAPSGRKLKGRCKTKDKAQSKTKKKPKSPHKVSKHRDGSHSKHSNRHGPSRQARVERSIEETPSPQLPTPEPSSVNRDTRALSHCTPAPSELGLFVSSAVKPTTPGPSRSPQRDAVVQDPDRLPTPMASSPSHRTLKRTREHLEEAGLSPGDPVADDSCQQRFALMKETFEERMEKQSIQIKILQAQGAGHGVQINKDRIRMDERDQNVHELQQEIHKLKQELHELSQRVDDVDRRGQNNHSDVNLRVQRSMEQAMSSAATLPNRPAACGQPREPLRPHNLPIRPREFYDLGRRGGNNPPVAVIPNTLVRSRPTPSGPCHYARRDFGALKPFRPAQPAGQNSTGNPRAYNRHKEGAAPITLNQPNPMT